MNRGGEKRQRTVCANSQKCELASRGDEETPRGEGGESEPRKLLLSQQHPVQDGFSITTE